MTMLTKLKARNFKCFEDVEIALGNPVVLIGPNNSGKTTVLQALALWTIGLQRWQEKRSERQSQARKRPGVTINRQDLLTIPHPQANLPLARSANPFYQSQQRRQTGDPKHSH